LKQKKRRVLDITGFFFRMSTQVKAEVRSTKAVTWVRMRKKKPVISNTGKLFSFNNNVSNLHNNSVVDKINGMTFNQTTTLKLIYWFTYHQSIVHFKKMSSILYPYVPINLIYFVNCYSYTVIYKNNVIIILKE
jgi:hypothetical protein